MKGGAAEVAITSISHHLKDQVIGRRCGLLQADAELWYLGVQTLEVDYELIVLGTVQCRCLGGKQLTKTFRSVATEIERQAGKSLLVLVEAGVCKLEEWQAANVFLAQIGMVFINDRFGRRLGLWFTWCLSASILAGTDIGGMQPTLPLYINELSPTQIRGLFTEAYTFGYVSGQLLASVALQRLNKAQPSNYKISVYTQWAMIGGLTIIYLILPESPWWLVLKGKHEQALKTLHRLKGGVPGYSAEIELEVVKNTIEEQRKRANVEGAMPTSALFKGLNLKRLIIALWPKLCQQLLGLSVFNNYAANFFQVAGNKDSFLVTVILSCCQLLSMCFTMALVDAWGRCPLAVYGYMITAAADFGMGGVGLLTSNATLGSLLVFFACIATFSTTSSSAIGYAYLSEIPKEDFRAKSAGWSLAIPNALKIIFYVATPIMIKAQGSFKGWGAKTGFFFGCIGAIVSAIGHFIIPETARRTPAEIDELFETRVNLRHWKGHVTDVQMAQREVVEGEEPRP